MSDMVVVYESNDPFWVKEIMNVLKEEGFHPELADDAGAAYYRMDNKSPGMLGMPPGRMKVSVVVPSQEEAAARLFLKKRQEQTGSNVAELTSGLQRPLILSVISAVIAFIMMAYLLGEAGACLGLSLLLVFPASFILTASAVFVHNEIGQICALIVMVASVVVGMYCIDKAIIYIGSFLLFIPFLSIAYVFFRTHKYSRSRKKDDFF